MKARLFLWRARMQFAEAVTGWLNHNQRYKPRTRIHYKMVINRFSDFAPSYLPELNTKHIEHYIEHILSNNRKNRTANAHLTALKSFCRWMSKYYGLPNPCLNIKMLDEDPPKVRVLNDKEYRKVLSICKPKEKDVINFLAHTGLRDSEFRQLTWENISYDRRFIKIIGKGRQRLIPLNKTCQQILNNDSIKSNSNTINFVKSYNSRGSLYRLCNKLAKHSKIKRFGPHALRHYFSTSLYRKGIPVQFISVILGHADTRTTERIYVHIWPPKDLLGITDCLD